jgi:L-amino acid N-acyltransferase YncA
VINSTDPFVIRRATEADWPAIWSIVSAVVATGDTYALEPGVAEPVAKEYWTGSGMSTYVAEANGEIVGTYALRANQRGLGSHVANAGYMVRPGRFGQGIGRRLCEHSLEEARAAGFLAMQFNAVVSTNTRAIALWERLGFVKVGTIPKAFRHAQLGLVDLLVMHRFL